MDTGPDVQVLRSKKAGYVVFFLLLSPSIGLFSYSWYEHPHSNAWQGLASALTILIALYAWIGAMRVLISDDRIVYKTLFSTKSILFSDIQRTEMTHKSFFGVSAPLLKLYDSAQFATRPVSIPVGAFPPEDVKRFGATLKAKKVSPILVK